MNLTNSSLLISPSQLDLGNLGVEEFYEIVATLKGKVGSLVLKFRAYEYDAQEGYLEGITYSFEDGRGSIKYMLIFSKVSLTGSDQPMLLGSELVYPYEIKADIKKDFSCYHESHVINNEISIKLLFEDMKSYYKSIFKIDYDGSDYGFAVYNIRMT